MRLLNHFARNTLNTIVQTRTTEKIFISLPTSFANACALRGNFFSFFFILKHSFAFLYFHLVTGRELFHFIHLLLIHSMSLTRCEFKLCSVSMLTSGDIVKIIFTSFIPILFLLFFMTIFFTFLFCCHFFASFRNTSFLYEMYIICRQQ